MKKNDFVKLVAKELEIPQSDMKIIVNSIFDNISNIICSEDKVVIHGFWTFTSVDIKERKWSHPVTKESIIIKPLKRTKFKPSALLKNKLNKNGNN